MKEIKGIGYKIPSLEDDGFLSIDSFSSLSETDLAIFSPDLHHTWYSNYQPSISGDNGKFEGKTLFNFDSSTKIREHIKHWKKELINFVSSGGTLFVILCEKEDFFVYTGTKDVSGTGRNQKVTNHVAPLSNYDYLPFSGIEYHSSIGKKVYPKSSLVTNLYNQFQDLIDYKVYLKDEKIKNATFSTKRGDRVLGANLRIKEGYLIFLQNIYLYINDHIEYNDEFEFEEWNKQGIKRGKQFIRSIVEIDKAIRKKVAKSPKPDWLNSEIFELQEAARTRGIISENTQDIDRLKKENAELMTVLEEQESLKDLLYETGKPLEAAVIKALKILGFKAEGYDDGELELDQIIFSPEGDRFIGECEGKETRAIDVSKFRQLLDGLNADFEREEIEEKAFGLLFGNPERLKAPNDRSLDFTNKCRSGAKREKIGLIKTADLFEVCKIVKEKNDDILAKKCRDAIRNQLGEIVTFPLEDI